MSPQSFNTANALRNVSAPSISFPFAESTVVDPRITFSRASSATYFNQSGTLVTAENNQPRIDFNAGLGPLVGATDFTTQTGSCNGLLIEESRTNNVTNNIGYGAVAASSIASVALSMLTNSSGSATATTSTSHGLSTGNIVTVSGCTPSNFNGIFPITVTSATTFTYVMTSNPGSNATVVGRYQAQTTGGTIPTRWSTLLSSVPTGMTATLVATGTYNGIPTVDVNYSGTPSSSGNFFPVLDNSNYSASAGQLWTISIYLALVGGTFPGTFFYVSNFTSGNVAARITSLTSTLQRITYTTTAPSGVTYITAPFFNFGYTSGVSYNFTLRMGLPQVELGAFPTSPIITGSGGTFASATRAGELATIPLGSWYNPTASTLLVEAQKNTSADTNYSISLQLDDNTNLNRLEFYTNPSSTTIYLMDQYTNNITDASVTPGSFSLSTPYKVAGSISGALSTAGTIAASLNGATAVSGTTGNFVGSTFTTMRIGCVFDNTLFMNGWIQKIAYYPVAFSNTQLQAMTS
jgi:hypothetical protein